MKKHTEDHERLERVATAAIETPFASALAKVSASPSRLVAQMAGARWPAALGTLLNGARRRKGLSRRLAARQLRERLREKIIARASRAELRQWERESAPIVPWLLVEYLEAIEAPVEEWIQVLIEFAAASGDSGYHCNVVEILLYAERATDQERRQLLPTLKEWVELQALMVGLSWRMNLVNTAIGELVPGVALETHAVAPAGMAALGERVEALGAQIAGLLGRAGAEPVSDGAAEER